MVGNFKAMCGVAVCTSLYTYGWQLQGNVWGGCMCLSLILWLATSTQCVGRLYVPLFYPMVGNTKATTRRGLAWLSGVGLLLLAFCASGMMSKVVVDDTRTIQ
jgi:hypothetical protein